MRRLMALISMTLVAGSVASSAPQSRPGGTTARTLTTQDHLDLELLNARYSWALATCDVEKWPALFTSDGSFTSGARGRVEGHHRLTELIKSYNCIYTNGVAPPHAPGVIVPYKLDVTASADGATGRAYYNGGRYEDAYVKTPQGWQFKSRTVVTNNELEANLTSVDFDEIHRLATANGGPYIDVYEPIPGGTRFKSTGVVIAPAPEGATGSAYLKDGGHYEDVYVKTSNGWRFKSRTYRPS
jgi:SnoaL-like domain